MLSNFFCPGDPIFLKVFDLSYAPPLLFYAYIPIIIVSLFLGIFVLIKDKYSIQSKLLFLISVFFSLINLSIIFQWITVPVNLNFFFWQISAFLEVPISLLSIYFYYVFINKNDVSFNIKIILLLLWLPIIAFLPTSINIYNFDVLNCQGGVGFLLNYVYALEVLAIFWIFIYSVKKYLSASIKIDKRKILILTTGIILFLASFSLSNIYGEITQVYAINLFGPIGMVIFLGLLSYMIVKFQTFNVKLIAAQALVWGLAILIGSQFFYITTPINRVINGVTLILAIFFGYFLVNSVKREIKLKEEFQKLNVELEILLKQRESLVHLVTHKVKGSFTRSKYIFAGMLDGTFGEVSAELKKFAQQGLDSDNTGIDTVDLVLNAANLQKGTVKYDMKITDFKDMVVKMVDDKKGPAEERGLSLETEIKDGVYNILGDTFWLKEAVNNLIENSIKYTRAGKITVGLENRDGKVLMSVRDTGVGITEEDKKNLFTEGGRGKESVKVNVDSTGYGLFTVKLVIEAHQGRVWAQSEGPDKGSTFFIELPAVS